MTAIHVAQLLKSVPSTHRRVEFEDVDPQWRGDLVLTRPVAGQAHLQRTTRGILVSCEYATAVQLECSRCLDNYSLDIAGRVDEEFLPSIDLSTGTPNRGLEDDDAPRIGPDHLLDLGELIRQDILVQIPLQPLCTAGCPGLCESCGADLRQGACTCPHTNLSGPFAALAELLESEPSRAQGRSRRTRIGSM